MDTSMSLDDSLDKVTCHVLRRLLDGPYGQQIWLVPCEEGCLLTCMDRRLIESIATLFLA